MVRRGGPGTGPKSDAEVKSLRSEKPWEFADKYWVAGWCPIPLPAGKKFPPPTGSTGAISEMPDKEKLKGWIKSRDAKDNIGLRMPPDVIGIDVDHYEDKHGGDELTELAEEFGQLPETWTLTSRRDGMSGIRFYRVPAGLHWPSKLGAGIETIRTQHRYAVAYPSKHPKNRGVYLWYGPGDPLDGHPRSVLVGQIPEVSELPSLPAEWIEGLTQGRIYEKLPTDLYASRTDILAWIAERPDGEPCRLMRRRAADIVTDIPVGSAHDAMNDGVHSLVRLAVEGHHGLANALKTVQAAFRREVTRGERRSRRSMQDARSEFLRSRDGSVRTVLGSIDSDECAPDIECGCFGSSAEWGEKLGIEIEEGRLGKAKPPDKYAPDDSGNADHLLDLLDGNARWVAKHKNWIFWTPSVGCWRQDGEEGRKIIVSARMISIRCREMAETLGEKLAANGVTALGDVGGVTGDLVKRLNMQAAKAGSRKGLEDMVAIASAQPEAAGLWEQFDAKPEMLACPNGTIELRENGVVFRSAVRNDMLSLSTRTQYVEGATSPEWDSYLDKFVPDLDVRRYLQKVVGSSLYGENRERKLFLLIGDPSSGKSTFVNAISGAIGEYARTFNLSLFRANQDEKARADIVDALPRRIICTSEASTKWELHADQVKRLTGGDPISGRKLFASDFVERMPAFVPIIATNGTPSIKGADAATRRRIVSIKFPVSMEQGAEDFLAGRRLRSSAARSAVLAWAVHGWELYCTEGLGDPPADVVAATEDSHTAFSHLSRFLNECVAPRASCADKDYIVFAELFDKWEAWCAENRIPEREQPSVGVFGADLAGLGYPSGVKNIKGKATRVRWGMKWVV